MLLVVTLILGRLIPCSSDEVILTLDHVLILHHLNQVFNFPVGNVTPFASTAVIILNIVLIDSATMSAVPLVLFTALSTLGGGTL